MITSILVRNAELDALAALASNGYIRIYGGTQPSAPEIATSETVLAEMRFGNPAFATPVNGAMAANAILPDSSTDTSGIASWFRVYKSDGVTALWDGNVSTANADLNLNSIAIQAGANISINAMTYTLPI